MKTETLRAEVAREAQRIGGRVWPNGIGFELDLGTVEFTICERGAQAGQWCAAGDVGAVGGGGERRAAMGDTPTAALLALLKTGGLWTAAAGSAWGLLRIAPTLAERVQVRGEDGYWSVYVDGIRCVDRESFAVADGVAQRVISGSWDHTESSEVASQIRKHFGMEGDRGTHA